MEQSWSWHTDWNDATTATHLYFWTLIVPIIDQFHKGSSTNSFPTPDTVQDSMIPDVEDFPNKT